MKMKLAILFLMLTFVVCGQTNSKNKAELTKIESNIESYIIEEYQLENHHSIEFHEIITFNLYKLIADYMNPTIYSNNYEAFKGNKEIFDWLIDYSQSVTISYSMQYIYGWKKENENAWTPRWTLIFLDQDYNIIEHLQYTP